MKNSDKDYKNFEEIFVSGANGFTGRFLCEELQSKGIKFKVILRPGSNTEWMDNKNIPIFFADLNNTSQLKRIFKKCDCLINIASIGFGSADHIIKACNLSNLKRVIFISSTSIFTSLNAKSKKVRLKAEKLIEESNLDWTIIRPTMIYGAPNDRNMIKLIRWIDIMPFMVIFGDGNSLQQPVHVKDLSWVIAECIGNNKTIKNIFNISGEKPLTFNEIIEIISEFLNKRTLHIYFPFGLAIKIFNFIEAFGFSLFIKSEQIKRLNEDKVFSYEKAKKILGYQPISFREGILKEIIMYKDFKKKSKKVIDIFF